LDKKLIIDGKELRIRSLNAEDVEGILRIERKITGQIRTEYWKKKLEIYIIQDPLGCLAAELEGRLVGFLISHLSGWEYGGVTDTAAWIELLAVDPDYHRKGIATILLDEVMNFFQKESVDIVYTLADKNSKDLQAFYKKMGFSLSNYLVFEQKIKQR